MCTNCLYNNHKVGDCKRNYVCNVDGCKLKHNRYLHRTLTVDSSNVVVMSNVNFDRNMNTSKIMMPIIPVIINNMFHTHALLYSGSSHSFVTKHLVDALNIDGRRTVYDLRTLNNTQQQNTFEVDISVQPTDCSESYNLMNLLVAEIILVQSSEADLSKYQHLKGLHYPKDAVVDILIGQDYADLLLVREYRKGLPGEPYAARTPLGWCFYGPLSDNTRFNQVTSNFVSTGTIEEKLDRLYELEQEGLVKPSEWSIEDTQVIKLWEKTCCTVDGYLVLSVPWKQDDLKLPNNYYLAKHRLDSLVSSLTKKNLLSRYDNEVQQLLENGYAEPAPCTPDTPSRCWYLPHHAVPKKSGELRLVYDCSSQYTGISINNSCLQGPKLMNDLFDVLIRFRQHKCAFMADIQHMYNRIKIPVTDRDAFRFLWCNDNKLVHYRMTCLVFGGIFCASASAYALNQTAQLTQMVYDTTNALAKRSFHLTKFIATDERSLEDVKPAARLQEANRHIKSQVDKALGIGWCVKSDELYIINKLQHACTRSELLSSLATLFDPLGIIAPLTMNGKLIFQETTRRKLPWNTNLPTDIRNDWNTWTDLMNTDSQVSMTRCLIPPE